MPEDKFTFLGNCIRSARKDCQLTLLIERLGISGNSLFPSNSAVDDEALQYFLGKLQSCNKQNQKMIINSLNFLVEQLLEIQNSETTDL